MTALNKQGVKPSRKALNTIGVMSTAVVTATQAVACTWMVVLDVKDGFSKGGGQIPVCLPPGGNTLPQTPFLNRGQICVFLQDNEVDSFDASLGNSDDEDLDYHVVVVGFTCVMKWHLSTHWWHHGVGNWNSTAFHGKLPNMVLRKTHKQLLLLGKCLIYLYFLHWRLWLWFFLQISL